MYENIRAYKGMDAEMHCSGIHYQIGKTYDVSKIVLAYTNPLDVLQDYPPGKGNRYFVVTVKGKRDRARLIADCITIEREISLSELIQFATIEHVITTKSCSRAIIMGSGIPITTEQETQLSCALRVGVKAGQSLRKEIAY